MTPMTEGEVLAILEECQTKQEWFDACQRIKRAHGGGYPGFWYALVIKGGVIERIAARWGGTGKITAFMDGQKL